MAKHFEGGIDANNPKTLIIQLSSKLPGAAADIENRASRIELAQYKALQLREGDKGVLTPVPVVDGGELAVLGKHGLSGSCSSVEPAAAPAPVSHRGMRRSHRMTASVCAQESKHEKGLAEEVGFEPTCPAHHRTTRFRVGPGTSTSVLLRRSLEPICRLQVKERSPRQAAVQLAPVSFWEWYSMGFREFFRGGIDPASRPRNGTPASSPRRRVHS